MSIADRRLLRRLWDLLRPASTTKPTPLLIKREYDFLTPVEDVAALVDQPLRGLGRMVQLQPREPLAEDEMRAWLAGRIGGRDAPPWADGSGGAFRYDVHLARLNGATYAPGYGALITTDGAVAYSSVVEALFLTPDLAALPGVAITGDGAVMTLPPRLPARPSATVFMAWGGRSNYGHFLLDCLPALCTVIEAGLLDRYPPVAPPLTGWQRDLLALMLGPQTRVHETDDELLRLDDVLFATPMHHFLHAPNAPLDKVRDRILARLPVRAATPKRLYLSRSKDEKRPMLNEEALVYRLERLGFVSLQLQDLPVTEQIAIFLNADVIVGATGAAFANCLFCAQGARVFEIQPSNYTSFWVRGLCHFVSAEWYGYFAPSPAEGEPARNAVIARPHAMFAWRLDVDDFMTFLELHLG